MFSFLTLFWSWNSCCWSISKDDHFPIVSFVWRAFLYSVRFLVTYPVYIHYVLHWPVTCAPSVSGRAAGPLQLTPLAGWRNPPSPPPHPLCLPSLPPLAHSSLGEGERERERDLACPHPTPWWWWWWWGEGEGWRRRLGEEEEEGEGGGWCFYCW